MRFASASEGGAFTEKRYNTDMDAKQWLQAWLAGHARAEELRLRELKNVSTPEAIRSFDRAFRWAIREYPPPPTSGLVEMQRWFMKARGEDD